MFRVRIPTRCFFHNNTIFLLSSPIGMEPFRKCHHVVDPQSFIDTCQYDVCGCRNGVECLCNAVAAYTKECATQGVIVDWRNSNVLPECGKSIYQVNLSSFVLYFRERRKAERLLYSALDASQASICSLKFESG